ncbi:MAG: hypothetical protein FGM62_00255 [Methylobacterium sp.]|nr:hypothetical protein [Methylobacterium sp.]
MKTVRILLVMLLVLFTADVVQAAPAELRMQLSGQSVPAGMPCHQDHSGTHPHPQAGADGGHCHACFACVKLVSAPAGLLMTADAAPPPVMLPQSSYPSRSCPPALRPPIPA